MPKIVHFEIPVDDAAHASAFYQQALGWEVTGFGEMEYWLVKAGDPAEPGADGALIARGYLHQTPVLIAGVEDLNDTLRRVEQAHGEILQGKLPIPGVGWSAYFRDSEGNAIGVFQADQDAAASA